MSVEDFVSGYKAAMQDLNGSQSLKRAQLILVDIEAAARACFADPQWLDEVVESATPSGPPRRDRSLGEVYLLADDIGRIKIGFTTNGVHARAQAISTETGHVTTVIASFPGTRDLEAALHERFAALRLRGEWFLDDPSIRQWVRSWQK